MSSTYDDTDVLSSSNTTTGLLYDFLGLFRNLDNASKGQTITHTGQAWEKSEKKTFL